MDTAAYYQTTGGRCTDGARHHQHSEPSTATTVSRQRFTAPRSSSSASGRQAFIGRPAGAPSGSQPAPPSPAHLEERSSGPGPRQRRHPRPHL